MAEVESTTTSTTAMLAPTAGQEQQQQQQDKSSSMSLIDLTQPILTISPNMTIRMLQHSDASSMAALANNKKIAQNMSPAWPDPYDVDSSHDFIALIRNQSKWTPRDIGRPDRNTVSTPTTATTTTTNLNEQPAQKIPFAYAITLDDKVIGSIGIQFEGDISKRSASFGYWIGEEYWGQGHGTKIVRAFVHWFWRTFPHIVRLQGTVHAWNPASARVLEKAGLLYEGRLRANVWRYGKLTDLLVYAAVRDGVEGTDVQPFSGSGSTTASGT